jgi:molybdate transport system regulatory protein
MASKTEVGVDIFIRRSGREILTPRTVRLLEEIGKSGSLRTAAKSLGISYQHIWDVIDAINRNSGRTVVEKRRGGTGGGGALLSDYGKLLLREYGIIESEIEKFISRLNTEINL